MSRDEKKLKVFAVADELVVDVYRATKSFPASERYGLQSQIRRAAVSVPTNLIEGCARTTSREYLRFVEIALGSASEVRYLLDLARRLDYLDATPVVARYAGLIKGLQGLVDALQAR